MQKLFVDPSYTDTRPTGPPPPRLQPARGQQARAAQGLRLAIWPSDRRASDGPIAGARSARTIGDGDRRSAIGDGDRRSAMAIGDGRCLLLTVSNKTLAVWAMPKQAQLARGIVCAGHGGALGHLGHFVIQFQSLPRFSYINHIGYY